MFNNKKNLVKKQDQKETRMTAKQLGEWSRSIFYQGGKSKFEIDFDGKSFKVFEVTKTSVEPQT